MIGEKRRERRAREGGRGRTRSRTRGARRRIEDVRAFVRALYIGRRREEEEEEEESNLINLGWTVANAKA